jgi:hypothetical protein
MTRSAPASAQARGAQAATSRRRKAAAGEGDDVRRSGHGQSRLREDRRGTPGRPLMTRTPMRGPAPPGLCQCRRVLSVSERDPAISGLNQ